MSGPEGRIQQSIQKAVRARGAYVIKIHGSPMMPNGTPDLLMCYRGYFVAMEVKTPSTQGEVSPAQHFRIDQIRAAGGSAIVVWSEDMATKFLDGLDRLIAIIDDSIEALPTEVAEEVLRQHGMPID